MAALFRELLGDALDRVPAPIRALHEANLPRRFEGRAQVRAAQGLLARGLARLVGLPGRDLDAPVAVTIERDGDGEIWTRHFPPRPMRSRLWQRDGVLHERLGPVLLRFRLEADATGLTWHPLSASSAGAPAPAALLRGIRARESLREGRYGFDVGARLPGLGHVVAYEGWLDVD
jgi:hypothetical protein